VLLSFAGTAAEGLFIGQLRENATCLVLALSAEQFVEMPVVYCSPTGHIERNWAKLSGGYVKRLPKKLLGGP
jgi:hypothetical protein